MRGRVAAGWFLAAAVACLSAASAQEAAVPTPPAPAAPAAPDTQGVFQSSVLTINQQRLFEESAFGIASLTRLEADSRDLQAEIRKIESDLEIEERLLTERRAALPPEEFQPLARAFDDKVEKIRAAWGAKDRELKRQRDLDQQKFFESAVPVLAELMQEMGAVLLVDQSAIILSLDRVDITQMAIDRIDSRLAPDSAPLSETPTAPPSEPAPEPAPAPAPETAPDPAPGASPEPAPAKP